MCLSWPCSATRLTGCSRWWPSPARRVSRSGVVGPSRTRGWPGASPRAPACKQDYTTMPGPLGAALRESRFMSGVGVPIVVQGSIWGHTAGAARGNRPPTAPRTSRPIHRAGRNRDRRQPGPRPPRAAGLRAVGAAAGGHHGRPRARVRTASRPSRRGRICLGRARVIVTRYEPDGTAVTVGEAFRPDLAARSDSSAWVRRCHGILEASLL